jgi:1-acyl-sn-glycerol-3-phosphate acyltransferase
MYDAVALGLGAYARARFRICPLGERFQLKPRSLVVSTHRSDADVPVLIGTLYPQAYGRVRVRGPELQFAVRDDLFLPGFFAGYPPGLPTLVRRALFRIGIGAILHRRLPCHPLRSATRIRVVELLGEHPDAPIEQLLPEDVVEALAARGLRHDARARDALRGKHAKTLWQVLEDDSPRSELVAESSRRRRAAALADFRELVDVVRTGGTLLLFPEGRPSPDGALGPMQPGLAALVRRAKPTSIRPVALAYDPLVREGRPLVYVGIGKPAEPVADDAAVLELLRRTTPLTAGQLIASGSAAAAEREVEAALEAGRPVAPELVEPDRRRQRLAEARAAAAGRDLHRLALEYRSART